MVQPDGPQGVPVRVFIADDSKPVADMLVELLGQAGRVEVVGVGDSEQAALEGVRRLRPDVVVLDLQLRGGSGLNVIRAVRADARLARTRLFVASSHVSSQMRAGCLELGADDYYDKVKDLGTLAARIAALADET